MLRPTLPQGRPEVEGGGGDPVRIVRFRCSVTSVVRLSGAGRSTTTDILLTVAARAAAAGRAAGRCRP